LGQLALVQAGHVPVHLGVEIVVVVAPHLVPIEIVVEVDEDQGKQKGIFILLKYL
jgi:hypothetical protein